MTVANFHLISTIWGLKSYGTIYLKDTPCSRGRPQMAPRGWNAERRCGRVAGSGRLCNRSNGLCRLECSRSNYRQGNKIG